MAVLAVGAPEHTMNGKLVEVVDRFTTFVHKQSALIVTYVRLFSFFGCLPALLVPHLLPVSEV